MSGHSKWSTIKHKKGAADARRGKIFTKLIKEISVAAKLGGGDVDTNPRLRSATLKARGANMPKDNIERAIKKGTGDLGNTDYFENIYEGYGPGGVAIIVETLTDNKNRTAADLRSTFSKAGGNLGESGCVSYMFNRKGVIAFETQAVDEEKLFEAALEAGAEDVTLAGTAIEVITSAEKYESVLESLNAAGYQQQSAEITRIADTSINLDTEGTAKVLKLLNSLDDNDDVQNLSSNLDIPDDMEFDE